MAKTYYRTIVGCVVLVIVLIALIVAGIYGVRAARQAARHAMRVNMLKQVGLALYNFCDVNDRLPPVVNKGKSGKPLSSWRFRILPYIEAIMMDVDYDAEWNDTTNECNRGLYSSQFLAYCWATESDATNNLHTNVMAITGPGTAFEDDGIVRLGDMDKDTILAVEVADRGIHWMQPGDIDVRNVSESIAQGMDGEGVHVLFADGAVWYLRPDTPLDDLKIFFTIEGAKQYDREKVLGPYVWRK